MSGTYRPLRRAVKLRPWPRPYDGALRASAAGIVVQSFALAARMDALQDLCDDWLNSMLPPEVALFRPISLPFAPESTLVFASLLHYPEMGDRFAWETGTLSQTEMYFAVPVERRRIVDGRERHVESGLLTPYIFVDNPTSATEGRERFGFRKEVCEFDRGWDSGGSAWGFRGQERWRMSAWDPDPLGHVLRTFVRVEESPRTLPLRGSSDRFASGGLDARALWWVLERVVAGVDPRPRGSGAARALAELVHSRLEVNVFNFRQFCDPEFHRAARYQDLVRFRMRIGDVRRLAAMTGAHRLLLSRSAVRPVAQKLGLRISAHAQRDLDDGGGDVIDARAPFLAEADVDLVGVDRICWRHRTADWRTDDGLPINRPTAARPRWSDALGASVGGAFIDEHSSRDILDAKFLVVPVPWAGAVAHIDSLLPTELAGAVRPMRAGDSAALRLFVSRSRDRDPRDAEELVWLDGSYLSLSIPVEVDVGGRRLQGLFLVTELTDNGFLLQAVRELILGTTQLAQFVNDSAGWFSSTHDRSHVLRVNAMAMLRSAAAASIELSPVLDVWRVQPADVPHQPLPPGWDELERFATDLRPLVTYGEIPGLGVRPTAVARRLMVTNIVDYEVCDTPAMPTPAPQYAVLFHASESFPCFDTLAMEELPPGSALGNAIRRDDRGRIRHVFARAVFETALRIKVRQLEVLWEDDGVAQPARVAKPLRAARRRS